MRGLWGDWVSTTHPSLQPLSQSLPVWGQPPITVAGKTFISDPKQEDLKGGGAGPERGGGGEGYVQRVGEELGSIEQVMSACDCLSIQEVFQVPLPLFWRFPVSGAQE